MGRRPQYSEIFRGRPGAAAGVAAAAAAAVVVVVVVVLMWSSRQSRVLIDVTLAKSIASGCGYDDVHGVLYVDSERFLDPVAITAGPDRVTAPGVSSVPTWLDLGHSGGGGWWWPTAVVRLESIRSIRCVQRKLPPW